MTQPYYSVDTFRPQISLGYLLRRVYKLSLARLEARVSGEVNMTRWIVLAMISHGLANTCRDLSRDMGHNSGAMTRLIDQLEEHALVRRIRDNDDRRVSNLEITEAGRAALVDNIPPIVDVWNDILCDVDRDEVDRMIDTLTKLLDRLEADADSVEA